MNHIHGPCSSVLLAFLVASCGGGDDTLFDPSVEGGSGGSAGATSSGGSAGATSSGGSAGATSSGGSAGSGGSSGAADASVGGAAGSGGVIGPDASDAAPEGATPDAAPDGPVDAAPEASCFVGTKLCNGECVPSDNPSWGCLGSSCTPCTLANATPACSSGECSISSCVQGFGDCNLAAQDGCETHLDSDVGNCGGCAKACSIPNASAKCNQGTCELAACSPGWGNCNLQPADGCETGINSSPSHCGGCNLACSYPNADASCNAGQCALGACSPGFGNCDSNPANGCETSLLSDSNHCGQCFHACSGASCQNGTCVSSTPVVLAPTGGTTYDIALDANYVYWGSTAGVQRVPKSGGVPTVLATGASPNGIAVDQSRLYWADITANSIRAVPVAGGTAVTLASSLSYPWRVDTNGVNVFWTDSSLGRLSAVPVTGGATTTLASGLNQPAGIALDATSVYFTTNAGGTVAKVPLGGGALTILASGESSPMRVAVDATSAYFTTYVPGGTVKKVPLAGGPVVTLAAGLASPIDLAIDSGWVYFTENTTIKKVSIQGGSPIVLASSLATPNCIAVDGQRVYWSTMSGAAVMAVAK